jgi:hypothetical protein
MKLFHFSEDPTITKFVPRILPTRPTEPPLVWAIDEWHAPHYYFPRDCPRVIYWESKETTAEDVMHFFPQTVTRKIIAIEGKWLESMRQTQLYVYHFPIATFRCQDENAGYYTSSEAVVPIKVEPVGDLLERLVNSNLELRLTPSLIPLRDVIISTSLGFSMIRMRNANTTIDKI